MSKSLRASDLIKMLQEQIDQHGDGVAQVDAHGNWLPVSEVISWHGRTIVKHQKIELFPFHRKQP